MLRCPARTIVEVAVSARQGRAGARSVTARPTVSYEVVQAGSPAQPITAQPSPLPACAVRLSTLWSGLRPIARDESVCAAPGPWDGLPVGEASPPIRSLRSCAARWFPLAGKSAPTCRVLRLAATETATSRPTLGDRPAWRSHLHGQRVFRCARHTRAGREESTRAAWGRGSPAP